MAWRCLLRGRSLALFGVALLAAFGAACSSVPLLSPPLLYGVQVDPLRISPNGSGTADEAKVRYALGRRAYVTLSIVDPTGQAHVLRDGVLRAADQYETRFDGAIAADDGTNRRLLPDGNYTFKIKAVDEQGRQVEQTAPLEIAGADTDALDVTNLVIRPAVISPNNDADNDETTISYSLSKKAKVTVYATDAAGNFALILPPTEQEGAAGLPVPWDGKENGGRLLPDGQYTIHIKAVDKSGNVTEVGRQIGIENGGTPRMSISRVKFLPPVVPISGTLRVEITVKNIGDTIIKSLGPDPGTRYTLNSSYASFRDAQGSPLYYERPGRWRIGVMWNNAPQPYPVRWGFGKDLKPGEEVTVNGEIVIDVPLPYTGTYFWAGIEQGGVGFYDTNKGQTEVRFSY